MSSLDIKEIMLALITAISLAVTTVVTYLTLKNKKPKK